MEYVIVNFPESRGVLIDDNSSGQTNETLMVETGHHEFKLEGDGYAPDNQTELVENTTPGYPMQINFSKTGDDPQ